MTARQRGWLLPPAAVLLVAGVFFGRGIPAWGWSLAACGAAAASALLLKGRGRYASLLVFCFALGIFAGSIAFHPVLPEEGDYEIRGVVCDEIESGSFGQVRIYLSDVALDGRPLKGGAYWTFYLRKDEELVLEPGQAVFFQANLYHPRDAENPGGYNFRESLLHRGVVVGLYGRENLTVSDPESFSLSGFCAGIRHRLSLSLTETLGEETGAYASALLLGLRSKISSEDREAFSRLGIAHILTVSGFHVGVLITVLGTLFRLLRLRQGLRLSLYALMLFSYAALCGMSQPVIRASLLLILFLAGRIQNRPRSGIHLLSASLFIMTLWSPVQVTSASFQMTFCAVFGLFWFAPFLSRFRPLRNRIANRIRDSFVITFGVQLGLLLPELYFFQRLPLLVFLVNLPAMLIASALICVFWITLLLLPVSWASALVSGPLSAVTGFLLSGVRSLASLPGLTLWIPMPTVITVLGVILVFAGCCAFQRIRVSVRSVLAVVGAALVVFSLLPAAHTATEYIQFSAGNADAAVLWDRDKVYVMDTGEADGTLSGFLRARRLTPAAVILTHLHADHAGGLLSLLEDEIPIPLILLPEGADLQDIHPDFPALLRELEAGGTEIRTLGRGDVLPLPSGTLTVLWPERGRVRPGQDANNYSLVCRLSLKGTVLLQTGDISGSYEHYSAVPADLLKAAHHGSPSSTLSAFLTDVSPSAVLLSCRQEKRLTDFRERAGDVPVWGTPESGALTVRFDDGSFTVIPFVNSQ